MAARPVGYCVRARHSMNQVEERVLDRSGGPLERLDLLAGASYAKAAMPSRVPTILVFDSGLGGLTVFREVTALIPGARYVYAADDAGFPYGRLGEAALEIGRAHV